MDFVDIEVFLILLMFLLAILALVIGFFRKHEVFKIVGLILFLLILLIGNVFRLPGMLMPPPKPLWVKALLVFSSCFFIAGYVTQYRLEKYLFNLSKNETAVLSDNVASKIERSCRISVLLFVLGLVGGVIGIIL
jgi:hypothetical protein